MQFISRNSKKVKIWIKSRNNLVLKVLNKKQASIELSTVYILHIIKIHIIQCILKMGFFFAYGINFFFCQRNSELSVNYSIVYQATNILPEICGYIQGQQYPDQ